MITSADPQRPGPARSRHRAGSPFLRGVIAAILWGGGALAQAAEGAGAPAPLDDAEAAAAGVRYADAIDLLTNGGFEAGDSVNGAPPPWRPAMTSPEVNNAPQGTVETVVDAGVAGSRAIRLTKLASALWWPQLWNGPYALEAGATYEFSAMARGTLPTLNLRATAVAGSYQAKMSRSYAVSAGWSRLRFAFAVPPRTTDVSVGFAAPAGISGEVFIDQAWLRRVTAAPDVFTPPSPLSSEPDPDPVQGLDAFMARQGHKPYDLFTQGDELKTLRLIFRDRQFGTWVWMLDTSPTVEHSSTASIWSPWNVNGSTLFVEGPRPLGEAMHRGWFFNADFSRMRPAKGGRPAVWAPDDPDTYYGPISPEGSVSRSNWRTGETAVIAAWDRLSWPGSGQRVYGLTRDGRHLFVDLPNRGIFVPFTQDKEHPVPPLPLYDGRPIGPGGRSIGFNHVPVVTNHEQFGDLIALRTGLLVDRQTGEKTQIAAPLCGNTNYLRAFHEGRVKYPQGEEWNAYGLPGFAKGVRLPTGLSMDELYALWRHLPHVTHGHESPSPDWEYIAADGGATRITRVRDGETYPIRLSPNGGNYHLHWNRHPRFLVGWVRGWDFGSYLRPQHANVEFQIFTDGTAQPIVDTKHRVNGYYSGGDFAILSPDATKIHYGSSMTGRFRNYVAVMARPRPPAALTWTADERAVLLQWQPSPFSREARGYLVYRSTVSGDGYELLTATPVAGSEYRDAAVAPGLAYFYVVSSLEHSGLESGYSAEAGPTGVGLSADPGRPLVVYAEAEHAVRDLGTDDRPGLAYGVDRRAASDWAFLYRHPEAREGAADLAIAVPASARYTLWARVRNTGPEAGRWAIDAGGRTLEVEAADSAWTWVRAGGEAVSLERGPAVVRLRTAGAGAHMDLLCLATDNAFTPQGHRPEKHVPPPPVTGLTAENLKPRVNRLAWQASADPTLSHYNVYAAADAEVAPTQEHLLGSPTDTTFIDWGLRPGLRYHYAVTAVDRRGNESAPVLAVVATPPAPPPSLIRLTFAEGTRQGPFETSQGAASYGSAYLVPQEPKTNAVSWPIEVPRDGDYYPWLRYLHRGAGGRGGEVQQALRVLVDGQAVLSDLGGGATDLQVPDSFLAPGNPLAERLWTWACPGVADLQRVRLTAGKHALTLDRLTPGVRYDALVLTDEPSWVPPDGRLRQR